MSRIEVNAIEPQSGTTLTIGASGDTIALASGATATGFGRTGTVNWDTTAKTTGFTAVSGNGYFCNTTSSAFTVTLPATPAAGDIVAIADYANTSATNNITVGRNGSKIDGETTDAKIKVNGQVYTLVYVDATEGWKTINQTFNQINTAEFVAATGGTVLTCGDFKTHVFTGPGTFTVSSAGNSGGSNSVEYLVVAGGGGSAGCRSGGGGAGGYRQNYPSPTTAGLPVTATSYPITVGSGGAGSPNSDTSGTNGNNSIFSTITSTGGGSSLIYSAGSPGGSGGGGSFRNAQVGGTGNTPPVSPPQGNPGGVSVPGDISGWGGGGGGGGASATGGSATACIAGAGGIGSPIATTVFGPTSPSYGTPGPAPGRYFAGGGGGGVTIPGGAGYKPIVVGPGGAGGGAAGQSIQSGSGIAGTTNTGGGGGGASNTGTGGAGGSGIVVIRYKFQ